VESESTCENTRQETAFGRRIPDGSKPKEEGLWRGCLPKKPGLMYAMFGQAGTSFKKEKKKKREKIRVWSAQRRGKKEKKAG